MSSSLSNRVNLTAKRLRRGLTLIEAAMVLTILALVIAGVMLFYQNATTNQKISTAAGQVAAIQQAVRSMYSGRSSYNGLANTDIVKSLPASMIYGTTGSIRNAFNGEIVLAPYSSGGTNNAFTVNFAGLPSEACVRLATVDMGRAVIGVAAAAGATAPVGSAVAPPMTPGAATTACSTNSNSVLWVFY